MAKKEITPSPVVNPNDLLDIDNFSEISIPPRIIICRNCLSKVMSDTVVIREDHSNSERCYFKCACGSVNHIKRQLTLGLNG